MRLTKITAIVLAGLFLTAAACAVPVAKRTEGSVPVTSPSGSLGRADTAPAAFVTKDLTTSTVECNLDSDVWVSVTVTNVGGRTGTYPVILKIGNNVARTANVTLAAGASQKVWFILYQATDLPALEPSYTISIDGLRQNLVVL
jgi:hypothetical protein